MRAGAVMVALTKRCTRGRVQVSKRLGLVAAGDRCRWRPENGLMITIQSGKIAVECGTARPKVFWSLWWSGVESGLITK